MGQTGGTENGRIWPFLAESDQIWPVHHFFSSVKGELRTLGNFYNKMLKNFFKKSNDSLPVTHRL